MPRKPEPILEVWAKTTEKGKVLRRRLTSKREHSVKFYDDWGGSRTISRKAWDRWEANAVQEFDHESQ